MEKLEELVDKVRKAAKKAFGTETVCIYHGNVECDRCRLISGFNSRETEPMWAYQLKQLIGKE